MTLRSFEIVGKVSKGVITVTLNGTEMAAFDLEGRVLYYGKDSSTYRRSIYNKVYRLEWIRKEDRIVEREWQIHNLFFEELTRLHRKPGTTLLIFH